MTRNYKRKTEAFNREKVTECLQYMRDNKLSLLAASAHFGLDGSTVRYYKKKEMKFEMIAPIGRQPSHPDQVQEELATVCRISAENG
jgi:hypothetical protein